MRFAELNCKSCGTFIITFDNDIPKQKQMLCPNCSLMSDIIRIDAK